jgi:hypothetical protein
MSRILSAGWVAAFLFVLSSIPRPSTSLPSSSTTPTIFGSEAINVSSFYHVALLRRFPPARRWMIRRLRSQAINYWFEEEPLPANSWAARLRRYLRATNPNLQQLLSAMNFYPEVCDVLAAFALPMVRKPPALKSRFIAEVKFGEFLYSQSAEKYGIPAPHAWLEITDRETKERFFAGFSEGQFQDAPMPRLIGTPSRRNPEYLKWYRDNRLFDVVFRRIDENFYRRMGLLVQETKRAA